MKPDEKIQKLEVYKSRLLMWRKSSTPSLRSSINQETAWARREVTEAGCFNTVTVTPPPITSGLIARNIDSLVTAREREVFALVTAGLLNKQVADHLDVAEKTVKVHRARVVRKMGAGSLADLMRMERLGVRWTDTSQTLPSAG